ncbi:TetR family transcriptional regulator, partial [Streptomyces sp. SID5785]|nr:TetR family transcriptional regulator [Streptomyces sp. SID5785]
RRRAEGELRTLVRRAQAAGALRADFEPSDLGVVLMAHCGLVAALPDDAAASRRLVAYLLDSFRADAAHGALPPAAPLALGSLPLVPDAPRGRRASRPTA